MYFLLNNVFLDPDRRKSTDALSDPVAVSTPGVHMVASP